MTVITIQKNILEIKKGFIVHQVNSIGVMNKGLAKEIRIIFPEAYEKYRENIKILNLKESNIIIAKINDDLYIVNLVGQLSVYKASKPKLQTDYNLLRKGLFHTFSSAYLHSMDVYIPYKIGCGLGGGDWNIVEQIIEDEAEDLDLNIYICKL